MPAASTIEPAPVAAWTEATGDTAEQQQHKTSVGSGEEDRPRRRAASGDLGVILKPRQKPLGSVLPCVQRTHRCPGYMSLPLNLQKRLDKQPPRSPRLYILVVIGEGDAVGGSWVQTELDAPSHVEVITHEWPGHGERESEDVKSTLQEIVADVFETFSEAMSIGHFIMCGDSVGALVMTHVCERAKRELGVSPQSVFAIEWGPPHLPVFSQHGYRLLLRSPEKWLSIWNPTIYRLHKDGRVSEKAIVKWTADMGIGNETPPSVFHKFTCRLNAIIALKTQPDLLPPNVDDNWLAERKRCTRTGEICPFLPDEYDQWREWADDVWIYEVSARHDDVHRSSAFLSVLWKEVSRVLGDNAKIG